MYDILENVNEQDHSPVSTNKLDAIRPTPAVSTPPGSQGSIPVMSAPIPLSENQNTGAPARQDGLRRIIRRSRNYVFAAAVVVVIVASVVAMHPWVHKAATVRMSVRTPAPPTPAPTPPPALNPLTGQIVSSAAAAAQPVIGVMIENLYPNARPQSGLGSAGIVYEALAEGGITRFLAIFQSPLPPSFGPVRSLRPYYLDWGLEYGIPVAHAGGSQPALAQIGPLGMKDINALVYDGSYFFRTSDRYAPHNLYTNAALLAGIDTKLGFATAPSFNPLTYKSDAPPAAAPHADININFSTSPYAVRYMYNPAADIYARVMGGAPHIDRNTNTQIQVKNIVVEFVPTTYSTQNDGKPETDYQLIGQGQALIFNDGNATPATWSKSGNSAQTQLLGANGKPVAFNRGNTWYEIVPTGTTVTY